MFCLDYQLPGQPAEPAVEPLRRRLFAGRRPSGNLRRLRQVTCPRPLQYTACCCVSVTKFPVPDSNPDLSHRMVTCESKLVFPLSLNNNLLMMLYCQPPYPRESCIIFPPPPSPSGLRCCRIETGFFYSFICCTHIFFFTGLSV